MYEFSVLIEPAADVPGQWIAHCLSWDIVSQGNSWIHARKMLEEAVISAIEDDLEAKLDPADRQRAPDDCWARYSEIQERGRIAKDRDIDEMASRGYVAIAATMRVTQVAVSIGVHDDVQQPLNLIPPFMIAALQNDDHRSAC